MDKDKFLSNRLPTKTVDVDGGQVVVRALSRAEALHLRTLRDDQTALERTMLLYALVDPELDVDEVGQYMDVAGVDEVAELVEAIKALSGLSEGSPKSDVPAVRE